VQPGTITGHDAAARWPGKLTELDFPQMASLEKKNNRRPRWKRGRQ
jgi:hypothetical protein